jgi:hypothetical protein
MSMLAGRRVPHCNDVDSKTASRGICDSAFSPQAAGALSTAAALSAKNSLDRPARDRGMEFALLALRTLRSCGFKGEWREQTTDLLARLEMPIFRR